MSSLSEIALGNYLAFKQTYKKQLVCSKLLEEYILKREVLSRM